MKFKPYSEFPIRSPYSIIKLIRPMINGRTVCDLGCGKGDTMLMFLELGASKVIGVEKDKKEADIAIERGLDVIIGDVMDIELPIVDIYYNWLNLPVGIEILPKLSNTLIFVGSYLAWEGIDDKIGGIQLDVPVLEGHGDRIFRLHIIDKRNGKL